MSLASLRPWGSKVVATRRTALPGSTLERRALLLIRQGAGAAAMASGAAIASVGSSAGRDPPGAGREGERTVRPAVAVSSGRTDLSSPEVAVGGGADGGVTSIRAGLIAQAEPAAPR